MYLYTRLVKFPVKGDSSEVTASGMGGVRGEIALLATYFLTNIDEDITKLALLSRGAI